MIQRGPPGALGGTATLQVAGFRSAFRLMICAPFLLLSSAGCAEPGGEAANPLSASTFAALQERGASRRAMGVDQYTSRHRFEDLPDGGRIELQQETDDPAGPAQIRSHLRQITDHRAHGHTGH